MVPILQYLGFPILLAIGTIRLIVIIMGGSALLLRVATAQVGLVTGLALAAGTAIGGFLGTRISIKLNARILKYLAALLIGLLGVFLLLQAII